MKIEKMIQKSDSFLSLLDGIMGHFMDKFPVIGVDNEFDFILEVSKLRKQIYAHYHLNPSWSFGSYRDMFEIRDCIDVVQAKIILKSKEEKHNLFSHLMGQSYILDGDECSEIKNLESIVASNSKEIIVRDIFLKEIVKKFIATYSEKSVLPLLQEGWGDKIEKSEQVSKLVAKQLFLRLTQSNVISYNLKSIEQNIKLKSKS